MTKKALITGIHDRFACVDAEFFCRDGFGEDNAVACLLIAADDGRDFSQIRAVSCF